jgi:hypothetical protein
MAAECSQTGNTRSVRRWLLAFPTESIEGATRPILQMIRPSNPGCRGVIDALLRDEWKPIAARAEEWSVRRFILHAGIIVMGAGLYGSAMGWWRDPLQSVYVAVKFPLILLLTATGNALLNGMLAPLLGLNVPFRQSFLAILSSFSIAAAILGSFSPLAAFLVWNAPPLSADVASSGSAYDIIQLAHVAVIAFAGIAANLRLAQFLRALSGEVKVARRVLLAWLAGNLFLGSQLSWILRPFIGSPVLPVEFLRATAFKGNFYESVFRSVSHLLNF